MPVLKMMSHSGGVVQKLRGSHLSYQEARAIHNVQAVGKVRRWSLFWILQQIPRIVVAALLCSTWPCKALSWSRLCHILTLSCYSCPVIVLSSSCYHPADLLLTWCWISEKYLTLRLSCVRLCQHLYPTAWRWRPSSWTTTASPWGSPGSFWLPSQVWRPWSDRRPWGAH